LKKPGIRSNDHLISINHVLEKIMRKKGGKAKEKRVSDLPREFFAMSRIIGKVLHQLFHVLSKYFFKLLF
jgi:hypothetical protein